MGSSIISVGVSTKGRALGRQRDNWGMYRERKRSRKNAKSQSLQPEIGKEKIYAMVNLALKTTKRKKLRAKAKVNSWALEPRLQVELFKIGLAVSDFYHLRKKHSFEKIKELLDHRRIGYQKTIIFYLERRGIIPSLNKKERQMLEVSEETLPYPENKSADERKQKKKKCRTARIATPARPVQSVKVPVPPNRWLNHRITVQFVTAKANEKPEVYQVVPKEEANIALGKISVVAPLIRGLGNHRVGEEFQVAAPQGNLTYRLLAVS